MGLPAGATVITEEFTRVVISLGHQWVHRL